MDFKGAFDSCTLKESSLALSIHGNGLPSQFNIYRKLGTESFNRF